MIKNNTGLSMILPGKGGMTRGERQMQKAPGLDYTNSFVYKTVDEEKEAVKIGL